MSNFEIEDVDFTLEDFNNVEYMREFFKGLLAESQEKISNVLLLLEDPGLHLASLKKASNLLIKAIKLAEDWDHKTNTIN